MKKHPYKCSRCQRRKSLPAGTGNDVEPCKHAPVCKGWYRLDKCRLYEDEKSRGKRCDCHGQKTRRMPKFIDDGHNGGETKVLGPHRKGQFGCKYYVDKEIDIPFGETAETISRSADCPF